MISFIQFLKEMNNGLLFDIDLRSVNIISNMNVYSISLPAVKVIIVAVINQSDMKSE